MQQDKESWKRQILEEHKSFSGTLFVVGTGAVSFGWQAFHNACQEVAGEGAGVTPQELSALLIVQMRYFHRALEKLRQEGKPVSEVVKSSFKQRQLAYERIQESLIKHTKALSKDGFVRMPTDRRALALLEDENSIFFTLNYDELLENKFRGRAVIHLHGVVSSLNSLVLPSEHSIETYREPLRQAYSDQAHFAFITLLERATRIVFWGISLDPIDAEISVILAEACRERKDNIEWFSINPCLVPDRRVEYLFGRRPFRLMERGECTCRECTSISDCA